MDSIHDIRVLEGSLAAWGPFPHFSQNERQYQLEGRYFPKGAPPVPASIYLTDELLTKGLLFLGSAGCGKTNSMLRLSSQILDQMGPDDAAIFLDVKGDYCEAFYEEEDYVLDAGSSMLAGIFVQSGREKDRYLAASNFIKKRGAHALFIRFPSALPESQSPAFQHFADWLIAACSGPALRPGKIHLFLDGLEALPKLEHLDRAFGLLRSKSVRIIAGLQDVRQLFLACGRDEALTILDGFQSIAAFQCGSAGTDYLQRRLGSALVQRGFTAPGGKWTCGEPQIVPAVAEYEIQELRQGDAIVKLAGYSPFRFHFARYAFQP